MKTKVAVYTSYIAREAGVKVHGFWQQPHVVNGFDCYKYKGNFYPAYEDRILQETYIVLTEAMNPSMNLGA
jgi:hypothetical protein